MIKLYFLILSVVSLIHGCTTIDYSRPRPSAQNVPITEQSTERKSPEQSPGQGMDAQQPKIITTAALTQREPVIKKKKSPPASRQAVLDLLAQSKSAIEKYEYTEAESLLKRALRIEPGNAWLWHNMAILKFYQQDYQQAIQQALKSNNLEHNDARLQQNNAKVIKQSYIQLNEQEKPN